MGGDVPIDSETLLVTDFMNLKIKPAQSFGGAHKCKVYVRMFIGVSARTCMSIYVCTVFLKKMGSPAVFSLKKCLDSPQVLKHHINKNRLHNLFPLIPNALT
jgi:hypothetical protein